ncbi:MULTISPECIES: DUF4190 domain-containing protein [unclassified Leucobacter]|uniref:DUF4190 domain-containing protein n=1 Tax=unclassified Leucobacter TaxID=2621730 RepID=UPI003016F22E
MTHPQPPVGDSPQQPEAGNASQQPQYAAPVYAQPQQPQQPQYAAPQQAYSQPYAQQSYQAAYVTSAPTNTLAILSMIASIVGLFTFALFAIGGVVMGHISLNQIKRTGESGRGMAIAGLIVGYVAIGFWVLLLLFYIVAIGFAISASGY